jgi:hypothetical protein
MSLRSTLRTALALVLVAAPAARAAPGDLDATFGHGAASGADRGVVFVDQVGAVTDLVPLERRIVLSTVRALSAPGPRAAVLTPAGHADDDAGDRFALRMPDDQPARMVPSGRRHVVIATERGVVRVSETGRVDRRTRRVPLPDAGPSVASAPGGGFWLLGDGAVRRHRADGRLAWSRQPGFAPFVAATLGGGVLVGGLDADPGREGPTGLLRLDRRGRRDLRAPPVTGLPPDGHPLVAAAPGGRVIALGASADRVEFLRIGPADRVERRVRTGLDAGAVQDVAVDGRGRTVVLTTAGVLRRLRPDGSVDRAFGVDGGVALPVPQETGGGAGAIAIDHHDRILAGGWHALTDWCGVECDGESIGVVWRVLG